MSPSNRGFLRSPKFLLERWVQRGILHQLLLMASLVAGVAVLGGVAGWALTPAFESLPEAVWWSFLRLTDPGYLGDDEGAVLRVVSTIVTVLGYVLFMGSLIAIMTQWLANKIRKLESGITPIAMENHFVILGWTTRTSEIIKKLLAAGGRMERFFAQRSGSGKLRIVVLADEVDSQRRLELRESLGEDWNENQIFLRSGSSLQQEHLERLDLKRASVVIIPGADFELGGAELNDTRVVKTLLNLDMLFRNAGGSETPCIVAELFDPEKVSIARNSFRSRAEIIAGDRLISRLLSQSLRHPGVGTVLLSLLSHREGNGLYLRGFKQFAGLNSNALIRAFPTAVMLGVVSMEGEEPVVLLNRRGDYVLQESDLLILLAESYAHCAPDEGKIESEPPVPAKSLAVKPEPERHRFLILGWSYKVSTLLAELLESEVGSFEVTILSKIDAADRHQALEHIDLTERLKVHNVEGDYSLPHDLEKLEPQSFDHILFLASGRMQSSEEADARSVLGLLLLRSMLKEKETAPDILVELLNPDNAGILGEAADVVLVSPRLLSHLLAHVGLVPELNAVFDALICAGGNEVDLRAAGDLGLNGNEITFAEVQSAAASLGCVGLGFYAAVDGSPTRQVFLNPERDRKWKLRKRDRVVLLSDVH